MVLQPAVLSRRDKMVPFAFSHRNTTAILWVLFMKILVSAHSPGAFSGKRLPFLQRADVVGVWKLTTQTSLLPSTSSNSSDERKKEELSEIVLRLNDDGTFDRYSSDSNDRGSNEDELRLVLGRGGCWEYQDSNLILAPDRPVNSNSRKVHDTILSGKVVVHASQAMSENDSLVEPEEKAGDSSETEDLHLVIENGQVCIGKFMYPKKHKAFFDDPMLFHKTRIGTFQLNQLLGNLNARLKSAREEEKEERIAKFHKSDLYGRSFYLTTTPHKINPAYAAQDKRYDESKVTFDIRVVPITFHANNTFSAVGAGKVLRGRYGITGEERDQLWFQVSLFGAGRSAPGSVYSEGPGLTHEDRRGYRGEIQQYETSSSDKHNNRTLLHVQGKVYYGNDLGVRRLPLSIASFAMQEIVKEAIQGQDSEDEGDDDKDDDEEGYQDDLEDAFQ